MSSSVQIPREILRTLYNTVLYTLPIYDMNLQLLPSNGKDLGPGNCEYSLACDSCSTRSSGDDGTLAAASTSSAAVVVAVDLARPPIAVITVLESHHFFTICRDILTPTPSSYARPGGAPRPSSFSSVGRQIEI